MPPGEALEDDYVTSLLLKDAGANRKRYLTSGGFGSILSRRPKGNAPKPNTRFLKNILRETNSHNAALKAKEEGESRARLRELRPREGGGKRRRDDDEAEGSSKRRRGNEKPGRWANVLGGLGGHPDRRRHHKPEDDVLDADEKSRRRDRKRREHSTERGESIRRHHRTRYDRTSSSPGTRPSNHRRRERRLVQQSSHSKSRSRSRSPTTTTRRSASDRQSDDPGSDSDPLDELLGPKPPPTHLPRGRGAHKSSSSIDARFDPSYDAKADVNLSLDDGERDDWGMALEALRDRAKWRTQGADRLRAAGFTDEEVRKWEKGDEKDVEDVCWRKKGEGREWDRGKALDRDGDVELKADWGRLKGT